MQVRIALVGDYDPNAIAHRAIPIALERAAAQSCPERLTFDWKHTSTLGSLSGYHGLWCVPASPYASETAAVNAIRRAREGKVPFSVPAAGFNTQCSNLLEMCWDCPPQNTLRQRKEAITW